MTPARVKKIIYWIIFIVIVIMIVKACSSGDEEVTPDESVDARQLNEILAAKSPYAIAKKPTPVLSTHDWDSVFGGEGGSSLKYDEYGEVDELQFIAPTGTVFDLVRQVRKKTRSGDETIYFQVGTDASIASDELWIDGRFLDVRDVRPVEEDVPSLERVDIVKALRAMDGLRYTWNGSYHKGVNELLEFYRPVENVSERTEGDWVLSGVDTLGGLYEVTGGLTPLEEALVTKFGDAITPLLDYEDKEVDEVAQQLMSSLNPLDLLSTGDRTWVVLDRDEVWQSRYKSKFDGEVTITPLFDTVKGLLEKYTFVNEFTDEIEGGGKKFVARRWFEGRTRPVEETFPEQLTEEDKAVDGLPDSEF
jgi:hypothetical protein